MASLQPQRLVRSYRRKGGNLLLDWGQYNVNPAPFNAVPYNVTINIPELLLSFNEILSIVPQILF
jgi:hypothetical protein